ncbi:MAG: hypothetical protein CVT63_06130 [Candidatus Anoxymicrobium japonicum]|uniref:Uncharacterized protein n=1 Tax=Candidatus Anoxymicrobium japonicum TaxID=2013648 RepID=A0A2N3G504_9ACTN|nr:MAG: hypothetical protein CVT63_06130 [Candidatus Anoxymicrobium japonicum]
MLNLIENALSIRSIRYSVANGRRGRKKTIDCGVARSAVYEISATNTGQKYVNISCRLAPVGGNGWYAKVMYPDRLCVLPGKTESIRVMLVVTSGEALRKTIRFKLRLRSNVSKLVKKFRFTARCQ